MYRSRFPRDLPSGKPWQRFLYFVALLLFVGAMFFFALRAAHAKSGVYAGGLAVVAPGLR
jgi:hypothetical protein